MEGNKVKVDIEIKPDMAILLGMILLGGSYGIKTASKLLTAKSIKDMHDIGSSIMEQVGEQVDLESFESGIMEKLSDEERRFFLELKSAISYR